MTYFGHIPSLVGVTFVFHFIAFITGYHGCRTEGKAFPSFLLVLTDVISLTLNSIRMHEGTSGVSVDSLVKKQGEIQKRTRGRSQTYVRGVGVNVVGGFLAIVTVMVGLSSITTIRGFGSPILIDVIGFRHTISYFIAIMHISSPYSRHVINVSMAEVYF